MNTIMLIEIMYTKPSTQCEGNHVDEDYGSLDPQLL